METIFQFQVRGYELDSFKHVNHGVYLNYFEEARWQFFREYMWEYLKEEELFPVVTDVNIRYIRELKIFEKLTIKSRWTYRNNYLIAYQTIYDENGRKKKTQGKVDMMLVDSDRIIYDLPTFIKVKLEAEDA